ncbi:hypothetical protein BF49_0780 [Bradyrhizobium sp.]|uniref:ATP-binding protein n=1 Tax=Bradyrhizobium sp. TaxID=376 RepID=UPI0007C1E5CA|nr:ATP-binding protein [Bradyrhizobium sp.]CUT09700.1 hypothetical protein BF49_0780 [Bradyrhizobium sp.]
MEEVSQRSAILTRPDHIRTSRTEALLPDPERTGVMLSRFGYKFPEAIADLADNSIDAEANKLLIRVVRTDDRIARVLIVDNGKGMNEDTLAEAMRFGSRSAKTQHALGKYGFGLKSASLSQARKVTVLSRSKGATCGRRWTQENIGKGWLCEILNDKDVASFMEQDFSPLTLEKSGTIVVWEELEHLKSSAAKIDEVIHRAQRLLSVDLGLRFHRFLSSSRLEILLDQQSAGQSPSLIKASVKPLDPFRYPPEATKQGYPKSFAIELGQGRLKIECHIWPSHSDDVGYKLGGGKVSARQGFYFYRNDRLIQAGGWNGIREDDTEPHLSLARVKVDLPPAFDDLFKLDVLKSRVDPPTQFASAVKTAQSNDGTFQNFINDALAVYGRKKKKEGALFHFVPGRGFPSQARKDAKKILWERGSGKPRLVHFDWSNELEPYEFVRIDRDRGRLVLNQAYRAKVLQSKRASAADAPLVKLLLLFLLHEEFDRKASSAKYLDWLKRMNETIVAVLRKES